MKAQLFIDTWRGKSICASHVYGTLNTDDGRDLEIERALTKQEAKFFNEQDRQNCEMLGLSSDAAGTYKEGDMSKRFDTFEEVVAALSEFINKNDTNIDEVYYSNETFVVWTRERGDCLEDLRGKEASK